MRPLQKSFCPSTGSVGPLIVVCTSGAGAGAALAVVATPVMVAVAMAAAPNARTAKLRSFM
ncbi:hypothetical protein GS485_08045 [Rhodococcus hoagii]|nr:hypothetical protein [Prescottella equi]